MAKPEFGRPHVLLLGVVGFGAPLGVEVAGPRASAVLAMLALRAGSLVTTEQLIDGVWGADPPPSARNALQVHVSALRKALSHAGLSGGVTPVLVGTSSGYTLNVAPDLVDALVAELLLKLARLGLLRGQTSEADRQASQALGLWSGPELGGVGEAHFAETERPRLQQLRLALTEVAADAWLATGRHAEVITLVQGALTESPFHEGLWRRLMLALYRSGRSADALAAFDRAAAGLRDELGLDPGPELSDMQTAILRRDDSLQQLASVSSESSEPDAADATVPARPTVPLPFETTALVGRSDEVAAIGKMFSEDGDRLVTVLGPGGMGKTRVAVEVARERVAQGGSAVFVDLSTVDSVSGMMEELVRAFGGRGVGDDPVGALVAAVGSQDVLIVIDNVEQIRRGVGRVLSEVLAAAQAVRLLVTSRVALNVPAENRYPLRPMTEADATALFSARARTVVQGFTLNERSEPLVRSLCRVLDNHPLAVELAAARLRVVPLPALGKHLDGNQLALRGSVDAPDRHRTLGAAIAGSVALLRPATATVLAKLSVFRGGFTLDAASEVIALDDLETVEHLEQLIDSSLVVGPAAEDMLIGSGAPRFALLEPIRQFLAESLAEGGELALTRDLQAAHFLRRFTDGDASIALDLSGSAVTQDLANLDLAVRQLDASDGAAATRLVTAVYRRMSQLGRQPQLMEWVEDVLSVADLGRHDDALLRSIRGHILYNVSNEWPVGADDFLDAVHTLMELDIASYTAIMGCNYSASHLVDCGRFEEATEATDQAILWARELSRPIELNLALSAAQYVARFRQDISRAIELGLEGLELMRASNDRMGLSNALGELVNTLVAAGRPDEAQLLADEAEQVLDEKDGPTIRAVVVRAVGRSRIGVGRYREAIGSLMELIRLDIQMGATFREPGWVALAIEALDPSIAATVLGAAQRMQAETGDPDVMPPRAMGGNFELRLQEAHPRNVERGARLGWAAIQPEVAQWAANIAD